MSDKNQSNKKRLQVLLPLPLAGAFDYACPENVSAPPGSFVRVPFGARTMTGVVWDPAEESKIEESKLKDIRSFCAMPALNAANRKLIDRVYAFGARRGFENGDER